MTTPSKYVIVPVASIQEYLEPYMSAMTVEYDVRPPELINLFTDYWHRHIRDNRPKFSEGIPTEVYEYLTQWLVARGVCVDDIDIDVVIPMYEEAMSLLFDQLYTVMCSLYSTGQIKEPLEFSRWHGRDLMLKRGNTNDTQYVSTTGQRSGGERRNVTLNSPTHRPKTEQRPDVELVRRDRGLVDKVLSRHLRLVRHQR